MRDERHFQLIDHTRIRIGVQEIFISAHFADTSNDPKPWPQKNAAERDQEKHCRPVPYGRQFCYVVPGQVGRIVAVLPSDRFLYRLSLIHISEPTRQAEISYAVF